MRLQILFGHDKDGGGDRPLNRLCLCLVDHIRVQINLYDTGCGDNPTVPALLFKQIIYFFYQ